jgi:hypothetical protein
MTTRFNTSAPGDETADQVLARIRAGTAGSRPNTDACQSVLKASQTSEFSKAHREERERKMIAASLRYG